MSKTSGHKPRNERFLDALVEELRSMSDTDALEGENPEELLKIGERMLRSAKEDAGKRRLANAKKHMTVVAARPTPVAAASITDMRSYLQGLSNLTLAARKLDELSDEDVLRIYNQVKDLEGLQTQGIQDDDE
jgi:hypothetical protein